MRDFNHEDCDQTGYSLSLKNKVVVLSKTALPNDHPGQLFLCTEGNGANPDSIGRSVRLVSLSIGEPCRFFRNDVLGTLKPELLPEAEKLQLSQIRPGGAADLKTHEPQYSGYSFLKDGRYAAGVWLCSPEEVKDYVEMQKPYQHRVLICDRNDFAVMEVINGRLIFPTQEDLNAHQQEQKGGIEMQ